MTWISDVILELILLHIAHAVSSGDTWKYSAETGDVQYTHRRVLTVTTILIEPYAMIKQTNGTINPSNVRDMYEGYIVDLMDELEKKLGFRYRLVPVWDGNFGHQTQDDTWDGMIGELMRKEADIAAGPMFITEQRAKVVDFSKPFMNVRASILVHKPPEGVALEINSAEDLVKKPYIRYGTLNRGIIRRAFRLTNNTVYRIMWENMKVAEAFSFTETNEEGIRRVREGHFAFILPNTIADYVSRRQPCDIVAVDNFLMSKAYGLAVQKGSALLTYINNAMLLMRKDGTLDRLYQKWWLDHSECGEVRPSKIFSMNRAPRKASTAERTTVNLGLIMCCLVFWQNQLRLS